LWEERRHYSRALTSAIAQHIAEGGYDVVHTHFAKEQAQMALTASMEVGVPFTFTTHAFDLYDRENRASDHTLRTLVEHSARAVTISGYNREHMLSVCGEGARDKVTVVHCGIAGGDFPYIYDGGRDRALTVSRLVEKKGIDVLLGAIALLRSKKGLGEKRFHIVGDGPMKDALMARTRKLGLEGVVRFHGPLGDERIEELYRSATMFVLPCMTAGSGDVDGIPVTLMESLARGVPVISTDVSGIPELVVGGRTGLVVPERDELALAVAMERLWGDAGLRERLGRAGRKKVKEEFNIEHTVEAMLAIWRGALS
jgi:glycosyltransferase involved in cell wall biosynthesis